MLQSLDLQASPSNRVRFRNIIFKTILKTVYSFLVLSCKTRPDQHSTEYDDKDMRVRVAYDDKIWLNNLYLF
jgi:hypothetical protein